MLFTEFKNRLAKYVFFNERTTTLPTVYTLVLGNCQNTPNVDAQSFEECGITEPSSGIGYERKTLTASSAEMTFDNGIVSNANTIEYGQSTGNWGVITHAVLLDAQGKPCLYSPLSTNVEVNTGDVFRILPGNARFGFGDM